LDKAPDAFRTISEVADELDVPQHVLRFWETRFAQIKPMKRSGGRRYYRRDDVELLRGIRHLLYGQGYTIRGVQRILREQGIKAVQGFSGGVALRQTVPSADFEDHHAEVNGSDLPSREAEGEEVVATLGLRSIDGAVLAPPRPVPAMVGVAPAPELHQPAAAVKKMSAENANLLRGALNDLLECRQLLDGSLLVR